MVKFVFIFGSLRIARREARKEQRNLPIMTAELHQAIKSIIGSGSSINPLQAHDTNMLSIQPLPLPLLSIQQLPTQIKNPAAVQSNSGPGRKKGGGRQRQRSVVSSTIPSTATGKRIARYLISINKLLSSSTTANSSDSTTTAKPDSKLSSNST